MSILTAETHLDDLWWLAEADRQLEAETESRYEKFLYDPEGYARHKKILNVTWWSKQREIARAVRDNSRVLVRASHNVGKCVAATELITLACGRRVEARELIGKSFEILTLFRGMPTKVRARGEYNTWEAIYAIETDSGRRIERNARHPLWAADRETGTGKSPVMSNQGWRGLAAISPGDAAAVTERLPAFGASSVYSDAELKVLAYLIGDGALTLINGVGFSKQPGAQLDEFTFCVESLGGRMAKVAGDNVDWRIYSPATRQTSYPGCNLILELVRAAGLAGCGSRQKFVPEGVFRSSGRQIALFLSRLYGTDGWASVAKDRATEIGYCSTSYQLIRDIQDLLVRFGIRAAIAYRPKEDAWTLSIRTRSDIARFVAQIGIFGKEEAVANVANVAEAKQYDRNQWRFRDAPAGTYWEVVKSVELVGDGPTVAIEVPGHHTFLTTFWEHNTMISGGLVNWWYDVANPSICITTAPTAPQVTDLLWAEVRSQRARIENAPAGLYPRAPRIHRAGEPHHYAVGYTAQSRESFQGRHEARLLIVFDEATGIDREFWDAADGMLSSGGDNKFLAIYNPTDPSSRARQMEDEQGVVVIRISALDHPNIYAELRGWPKPIPNAISLAWVEQHIRDECEPINRGDVTAVDFEFPPGSGIWYRPDVTFESMVLGRWPSESTTGVWSSTDFDYSVETRLEEPDILGAIGCDVARFGTNKTAIHVRRGECSLWHESHRGWDTVRVAGRLMELARQYGRYFRIHERAVPVIVDDTGVGGGVVDILRSQGFQVAPVNAGSRAFEPEKYPNRRSELWFVVARRAHERRLDLTRLPGDVQRDLRAQCLTPTWKQNGQGQRVVEDKDKTTQRLGGSPDDADAMNLAYAPPSGGGRLYAT